MKRLFVFTFLLVISLSVKSQLLWEVSGNNLNKPSYLFGTVHLQDSRVFNYHDKLEKKLYKCTAFASEIEINMASSLKIMMALLLKDGQTLDSLYTKEEMQLIDSVMLEKTGMNTALYKKFHPALLMSVVMNADITNTLSELEEPTKQNPSNRILDDYLETLAQEKGLKTYALEKIEDQATTLMQITPKMVLEYITEPETQSNSQENKALMQAYINKDLSAIDSILNNFFKSDSTLANAFLYKRNQTMVESIITIWQSEKSLFAAVGAAHLPGNKGIIQLLRNKGYQVVPVE